MEPDKAGKAFQFDLHYWDGIIDYNCNGAVYSVLYQGCQYLSRNKQGQDVSRQKRNSKKRKRWKYQ